MGKTSRSERDSLVAEGREVARSLPTGQYVIIATLLDLLEAEFDRRHPEPEITEEMVERAADAFERTWDAGVEEYDDSAPAAPGDFLRNLMRAVLEAALRVPVGEGEQ